MRKSCLAHYKIGCDFLWKLMWRQEEKGRKKKDKRITIWLITSKFDSVQTTLTTETFESAK